MDTTPCFDFDVLAAAIDDLHAQTSIFTQGSTARRMLLRIGWPREHNGAMLDPSCGDGSFLIEALKLLGIRPNDRQCAMRVRGWEIHHGAVVAARERVADFLVASNWDRRIAEETAREMVTEADFLTDGPEGQVFDAIVGNPPYLRTTFLSPVLVERYRGRLPIFCQADILHAFLHRCVEMMPQDGVVSFVTADRWFFNEGCAELRERLGQVVGVDFIERLDPASVFYRPKARRTGTPPRVHPVEVVLRPKASAAVALTAAPFRIDGGESETEPTRTLEEIADVSIGPYIGPDGVFSIDLKTAQTLLASGGDLVALASVKDVDNTTETLGPVTRWGIVTAKDAPPIGPVAEHLQSNRWRLPPRCLETKWWLPVESLSRDVSSPSLLVPNICRTLRAIEVPAGRLVFDHNISVRPKPGYTLAQLRSVILSPEATAWMQRNAAPIENGFYQIRTRLFRTLRFPTRLLGQTED